MGVSLRTVWGLACFGAFWSNFEEREGGDYWKEVCADVGVDSRAIGRVDCLN